MYDPVTDRCAEARTSSLNEDLGQVQYIFSDKTGTLTENVMLFRKFCVDGVAYSVKRESPGKAMYNVEDQPADKLIENLKLQQQQQHQQHGGGGGNLGVQSDFLRAIALCHSSLPESSSPSSIIPGRESDATVASNSKSTSGFPMTTTASKSFKDITYQSSSPDDTALVGGARDMSFVFYARVAERIHLHCLGTKDEEYTVLNTIEFSSKRKRMSVICKYPDGSILLLCKGADSVIVERLSQQQQQQSNFKETMRHVERFATEGLRTLLYGYKKLSPAQYDTWAKRFSAASVALERRQERIEEVAEEIETDLILLGATAIEDKLQAGVPETISKLQLAGKERGIR